VNGNAAEHPSPISFLTSGFIAIASTFSAVSVPGNDDPARFETQARAKCCHIAGRVRWLSSKHKFIPAFPCTPVSLRAIRTGSRALGIRHRVKCRKNALGIAIGELEQVLVRSVALLQMDFHNRDVQWPRTSRTLQSLALGGSTALKISDSCSKRAIVAVACSLQFTTLRSCPTIRSRVDDRTPEPFISKQREKVSGAGEFSLRFFAPTAVVEGRSMHDARASAAVATIDYGCFESI
jgi:hypothetical protein